MINIAETANPENMLNLINDVAVESNNTDDSTILNSRIDPLNAKCNDLNELNTDGAYGGSDSDKKMNAQDVYHTQTAVRGRTAEVPMEIKIADAELYTVSCTH